MKKAHQLSLSDVYPRSPGFKRVGTSSDAARAIKPHAETLRDRCYQALRNDSLTADEIADRLESTEFSCRPRLSELAAQGLIEDSGRRRQNKSGKQAIVWRRK